MIQIEREGPVATLFLQRPKVNALSPPMVAALGEAFEGLAADGEIGAVVLASRFEKTFSAGFDLKILHTLAPGEFGAFIGSFAGLCRRLFGGAVPVVAAVGGHAVAGGAILALACDRRIFGEGSWGFGLTEVDLALPLPAGVLELLRRVVGERGALEVGAFGTLFRPAEALRVGLADRVVPAADVLAAARAEACALAAKPRRALRAIREELRRSALRELEGMDGAVAEEFGKWWFDPEAVERRCAFLEGRQPER